MELQHLKTQSEKIFFIISSVEIVCTVIASELTVSARSRNDGYLQANTYFIILYPSQFVPPPQS
jgi:hypothetical protein